MNRFASFHFNRLAPRRSRRLSVRVCQAWHRTSEVKVLAPGSRGAEGEEKGKGVTARLRRELSRTVGSGGSPIQPRGATHRNPAQAGWGTTRDESRHRRDDREVLQPQRGGLYQSGAYARNGLGLTLGDLSAVPHGTEGGRSCSDRSAAGSSGQRRSEAGKASEAPQRRKAGYQRGRAAPRRTEGPNGTPRGEGRRGVVAPCRAAGGHPTGSSRCPWAARSMGMKPRLGPGEQTLRWQGVLPLPPPNRRVRDPYARWGGRESGRPPTYVD